MAKQPQEHAGSGVDKPDPKTLLEKVGDGLKAILPDKPPAHPSLEPSKADTGSGTVQR